MGERSAQSHWQSPRRRASDEPEPEDLPVDQVSASSVSGKIRPQDSRARVPPCRAACSHLTGRMAKADASRFSCRECRLVPDVPGCPLARATREEVPSSHPAVSPCGAVPRRAKKGPPIQAGLFAWTRGKWGMGNGEWRMGNGECAEDRWRDECGGQESVEMTGERPLSHALRDSSPERGAKKNDDASVSAPLPGELSAVRLTERSSPYSAKFLLFTA